jgi:hypothetical protein
MGLLKNIKSNLLQHNLDPSTSLFHVGIQLCVAVVQDRIPQNKPPIGRHPIEHIQVGYIVREMEELVDCQWSKWKRRRPGRT